MFDKAAVRIRYDKARLNFQFEDYVDDQGQILPDQQVGKGSVHFNQHGIRARTPANCCRQLRLAKRLLTALVVVWVSLQSGRAVKARAAGAPFDMYGLLHVLLYLQVESLLLEACNPTKPRRQVGNSRTMSQNVTKKCAASWKG